MEGKYDYSHMIHEDPMEVANLPQEVIMRHYPERDYVRYDLDGTDNISGIDHVNEETVGSIDRHRSDSKY